MKAVIFDSGVLISFSMNCMLDTLRELKKKFNGRFFITHEIEEEIVKKPMDIKKYKLGALRLRELINEKIIEFPDNVEIDSKKLKKITFEFLDSANSLYYSNNHSLHLIDKGEASCLALSSMLNEKKIDNIIAMDERTTRVLCEAPENLRKLLEEKLHANLKMNNIPASFKQFKFVRSSELAYVAFKKGLIKPQNKDMLDAVLYAMKFKGCAITSEEIKEIEKM